MIRNVIACSILAFLASAVFAQPQPQPSRIGFVYPAGAQQGTSIQVKVGGRGFDNAKEAFISGSGVKATVIDHVKPPNGAQLQTLRDKLKDLQQKRQASNNTRNATRPSFTLADANEVADILRKLALFQKAQMTPALAEVVTLQITVAATAEPGPRELRLVTPGGLSNPIAFIVGQLPEALEQDSEINKTRAETATTLPVTFNGQITPGDVDRIRFKAKKGQKLTFITSARELIPYLADAVPGWFQAILTLYDAKGNEVAYADDYRYSPDPVMFYEVPADGDYVLEIKDSIYRGRDDFVYRISMGELPFITGVFPLGGKAGTSPTVELSGWNLPSNKLTMDCRTPGLLPLFVKGNGGILSNRLAFAVDSLPEVMEVEPNNVIGTAQAVSVPVIVNGRIDKPGDWDVYSFEGKAGDKIVAEVHARRLGSPVDSVVRITDASGKQIAYNDDHDDKGAGLETHHADSYVGPTTLPSSGTYYVHVGDIQRQGGPEFAYRLRISHPRPDYELRVTPSSINVRAGANVPINVYAIRKDGFAGEIALSLKDAPQGVSLGGALVPANQEQAKLTLLVPPVNKEPFSLRLEGRATIGGLPVVRTAVPAEDMMQAFAYRHLVPEKELKVDTLAGKPPRAMPRILTSVPIRMTPGGTQRVVSTLPGDTIFGKVVLELSDPPEGISIKNYQMTREGTEVVFQADAKTKPGLKGNLIVNVFLERGGGPNNPNAPKRRISAGVLPAIPFEVK